MDLFVFRVSKICEKWKGFKVLIVILLQVEVGRKLFQGLIVTTFFFNSMYESPECLSIILKQNDPYTYNLLSVSI